MEIDEVEGKELPTDVKSLHTLDCNQDLDAVIGSAMEILEQYDNFNKTVQTLKNEDPSIKKPMIVELTEEEKDDGSITERGSGLISNLLALSGKSETTTKNYYDA